MHEIQALPADLLCCPPARDSPEMVADVSLTRQHVAAHEAVERVPGILGSTTARKDGGGNEREEFHLADHGQVGMTRGQQALYIARQRMQISRTDAEIHQVVHTLALALGATWTQAGTRKALIAVLTLLDRPEMSEQERSVPPLAPRHATLRGGRAKCSMLKPVWRLDLCLTHTD